MKLSHIVWILIHCLAASLIGISINGQQPDKISTKISDTVLSNFNDDPSGTKDESDVPSYDEGETDSSTGVKDSNNGATKTYERVVLEGSRIRISCPHLMAQSFATSQQQQKRPAEGGDDSNKTNSRHKQFAFVRQQTARGPNLGLQVKWFRNHVPLMNLNHFNQRQTNLLGAGSAQTEANFASDEPQATQQALPDATNMMELERTTDSTQTMTTAQSLDIVSEYDRGADRSQQWWHKREQLEDHAAISIRSASSAEENVNELTGLNRMLANMTEDESDWFVNDSGELVINKVSRNFAGKYTCLLGGVQSEVLLDVLLDSGVSTGESRRDQAFFVGTKEMDFGSVSRHQSGVGLTAPPGMAKETVVSQEPVIPHLYNSIEVESEETGAARGSNENAQGPADHGTGNEPIDEDGGEEGERGESFESKTGHRHFGSLADANGSGSNDNQGAYLFGDQLPERASVEKPPANSDEKRLAGDNDFQVDNNPSREFANSIITSRGDSDRSSSEDNETVGTTTVAGTSERWGNQVGGGQSSLMGRYPSTMSLNIGTREKSSKPKDTPAAYRTHDQINVSRQQRLRPSSMRHPTFVVQSQAIQFADLRLVPGFLYTKQQLYCPVTGQTGFHFDYPLIRTFCPPDSRLHSSLKSLPSSSPPTHNELKCYQLAQQLIRFLVDNNDVGEEGINGYEMCSASVWDLVWFKDGNKLHFDTNGRGSNNTGANLNVKLIDSFDEFNGGRTDITTARSDANVALPEPASRRKIGGRRSHSNQSSRLICPPKGRTLEIDGLRKESAGRYSCAMKLSISKLNKIIKRLRQLNEPGKPVKWRHLAANDNDISSFHLQPQQQRKKLQQPVLDVGAQIETIETIGSAGSSNISTSDGIAEGDKLLHDFSVDDLGGNGAELTGREKALSKRIALLESILKGTMPSEQSLNYIEQVSSRVLNPLVSVQTFSLAVSECAANCDLWSTILEAGNAYTRRKLADFKRLKRSSSLVAANNLDGGYADEAGGYSKSTLASTDKSSPLSATPSLLAADQTTSAQIDGVVGFKQSATNAKQSAAELETQSGSEQRVQSVNEDEPMNSMIQPGLPIGLIEERGSHDADDLVAPYGRHSIHGNTIQREPSIVGRRHRSSISRLLRRRRRQGHNLLLNNANSRDSNIVAKRMRRHTNQFGYRQQTKSSQRPLPFDYANERNLRPVYAQYAATTITTSSRNAVAPRFRKRSISPRSDYASDEYLEQLEIRDLIRQRGYHGINIEAQRTTTKTTRTTSDAIDGPSSIGGGHFSRGAEYERKLPARESVIDDGRLQRVNEHQGDNKPALSMGKRTTRRYFDAASLTPKYSESNLESNDEGSTLDTSEVLGRGYKLRQLGRYSRSYSSSNQLDSQLISSANQSNGLEQSVEAQPGAYVDLQTSGLDSEALGDVVQQAPAERTTFAPTLAKQPIRTSVSAKLGETNRKPSSLIDEPLVYDDRFDESLMWTAGQYLYMHMRALAASSMFGVELAVEWSNERVNGSSSIDYDSFGPKLLPSDGAILEEGSATSQRLKGSRSGMPTINVITGQSLQLQCTAQALGRLPDVKWYKQISSIPTGLKILANKLVRRIGPDLYWPLTQLDLLDDYEDSMRSRSFVFSQTTTVFDNLVNQTFTVVNNLQLGQYNDEVIPDLIRTSSLEIDDFDLYACIVDADIRHNYATLGVYFREAANEIPIEIRKRLKALAVVEPEKGISISTDGLEKFSLYKESFLQFPLHSNWVPISNSSSRQGAFGASFSLSPTLLLVAAAFMIGSLSVFVLIMSE